jgi:hypothetical protein
VVRCGVVWCGVVWCGVVWCEWSAVKHNAPLIGWRSSGRYSTCDRVSDTDGARRVREIENLGGVGMVFASHLKVFVM